MRERMLSREFIIALIASCLLHLFLFVVVAIFGGGTPNVTPPKAMRVESLTFMPGENSLSEEKTDLPVPEEQSRTSGQEKNPTEERERQPKMEAEKDSPPVPDDPPLSERQLEKNKDPEPDKPPPPLETALAAAGALDTLTSLTQEHHSGNTQPSEVPVSELSGETAGQRERSGLEREQAKNSMLQGLYQTIADNLTYPMAARRRGTEGVVEVRVLVSPDGDLLSQEIVKTSGSNILDNAALAVLESIFPYSHSVNTTEPFALVLSITYKLS